MSYQGNINLTPKDLYAADATGFLSQKSYDFAVGTYKKAQEQMSDMRPMWIMNLLSLYSSYMTLPEYIQEIIDFDKEVYLRDGFLHQEHGFLYPDVNVGYGEDNESYPKVDQELVQKRSHYPTTFQEEAGKDPIQITAVIDRRLFDHSEKYFDFWHYRIIMSAYVASLTKAINFCLICIFAAAIFGFTNGLILPEVGSKLERFFQPTGKDLKPTEADSKHARQFYDENGRMKKLAKKVAGEANAKMKNIIIYDPLLRVTEVDLLSRTQRIPEITKQEKIDLSDLNKTKSYLKNTYFKEDSGKTKMLEIERRKCLLGLANHLDFCLTSASSAIPKTIYMMQYDPYLETHNEIQQEASFRPDQMMIFMNSFDLMELEEAVGSLNTQPFTSTLANMTIAKWRGKGASFFGLEWMMPGWVLCLHRAAFKMIVYFDKTYESFFPLQLVTTWIRHLFIRFIIFKNFPGFVLAPSKFSVHERWAQLYSKLIAK